MDCRCIVWRIVDNSFIHANDTSMILLWHFFVNKKEKCHWGNVQEVKWLGADGDSRMRLWYFFVQKMFRVNGIKGVSTDAFWKNRDTSCLLVLWLPINKNQDTSCLFIFWFQTKTKINHKSYDTTIISPYDVIWEFIRPMTIWCCNYNNGYDNRNEYQPPPRLKPILTFTKGRNRLLRLLTTAPT